MTDTRITMNFHCSQYSEGCPLPPFVPNTDFVPKNFIMDPRTDDLLSSGRKLLNGMWVLLEDNIFMVDPSKYGDNSYDDKRLLETQRWCKVTDLDYGREEIMSFIGEYADDTKYQRRYNISYAWYVKKDSIPAGRSPRDRYCVHGFAQNTCPDYHRN